MSIGDYLPKREFLLSKKFFTILAFVFGASFLIWAVYLYNPKFVPETVRVANDKIVDTVVGKDLASAIDQKRDTDGAVTIRELFNTNKEQNLEKHCEKKFEQGKEQEKCYKKYVNEELGYSFDYPVGWEVKSIEADMIGISPEGMQEDNLFLITKSPRSLEEEIEEIKGHPNSEVTSIATVQINGKEFKKITQRNLSSNNEVFYFLFNGDSVIILSGDISQEDVKKILDSFIINK